MAVENLDVTDIISIDLNGNTVLTVSNELKWDGDRHLLTLQNKINAYLSAIEGAVCMKIIQLQRGGIL